MNTFHYLNCEQEQGVIIYSWANHSEDHYNVDVDAQFPFIAQEIEIELDGNASEVFLDQDPLFQSSPLESSILKKPKNKRSKSEEQQQKQQNNQSSRITASEANPVSHRHPRQYARKCPICNVVFRSNSALQKHKLTHEDDVIIKCKHCDKKFLEGDRLTRAEHETECAVWKAKPKFSCPICSKEYLSQDSERRHRKTHSGIKPFRCEKCGNEYFRRFELTTHARKYVNQDICGRSNSRIDNNVIY